MSNIQISIIYSNNAICTQISIIYSNRVMVIMQYVYKYLSYIAIE